MPEWEILSLLYGLPLLLIFAWFGLRGKKKHKVSAFHLEESKAAGLTEPASLHPVIDLAECIGCGSCVTACPEKMVLGLVHKKAQLINPTSCVGHGACKAACPQDAIKLVFGSKTRGVDIPEVKPDFETNIPGLFIAGELGGMGLIRNAISQGAQAMQSISKRCRSTPSSASDSIIDVVIIGAGPAGISAMLQAKKEKLNYLTIEQDATGGTVAHFPRGKLVMTQPAELPLAGKMKFREVSKEELMEYFLDVIQQFGLKINEKEMMTGIKKTKEGLFEISTSKGEYKARNVLLSIGRRGTPRKLEVPGEEQSKVSYRLTDPEQYRGKHLLVVGGGDSALEAACSVAELRGTVTLSYRSNAFTRARPKNRKRVEKLENEGRLKVLMESNVTAIGKDTVAIKDKTKTYNIKNEAVIICAGGVLPTPLLKAVGVTVTTKYGEE